MLVFTHSACLQHDPGVGHPEHPGRLQTVIAAVESLAIKVREAPRATRAQLARAHTQQLIDQVQAASQRAPTRIDADTAMSEKSLEAAERAAGSGIAALDAVLKGETRRAFCAVRPPGHHATRERAMGFCLFNSIAVLTHEALQRGFSKIAVIDFDVHHGNGTQDIFWQEPRVLYVSSHQSPLYPGTGMAKETGANSNVCNAPLATGTGSQAFRAVWREQLLPAIDAFEPELLLLSAGFDAHYLDPLAGLELHEADFAWLTEQLVDLADRHARGRIISMLEGGYSLQALKLCTLAHLRALQGSVNP